jgi:CubicO group peptidase (beta-lactamase class C family)
MLWRSMAAAVPFVVLLLVASPAGTASLPSTPPEEVGPSSERLGRLGQWFTHEIAQGRLPGAVTLVARRGRIAYLESFAAATPSSGRRCPPTPSSGSPP